MTYLLIPDLQIPFEHEKALEFCTYLKRHYKIKDENVYNLGDEIDAYFGGMWEKSCEAEHTANSEIDETIDKLKLWYDRFPVMSLCSSNHGNRWQRKAFAAGIPERFMRNYQEVIQSPSGWRWRKFWKVDAKHPFLLEHGDDWGGAHPHVTATLHSGMSFACGHFHSKQAITHIKTSHQTLWGAVCGSLIAFEKYAFNYARAAKLKPVIGAMIVGMDGKMPMWIPLE